MVIGINASLVMLGMWTCKLKLDEKKSKHAGLAQQNGFGQNSFDALLFAEAGKGTAKSKTCSWLAR